MQPGSGRIDRDRDWLRNFGSSEAKSKRPLTLTDSRSTMVVPPESTLPIISIEPWLPTSDPTSETAKGRTETAEALHDACLRYGFFYLDISSFASKSETDELESLARQFFGLDQEKKDNISIAKSDRARGKSTLVKFYIRVANVGFILSTMNYGRFLNRISKAE